MKSLTKEAQDDLHRQLVKLGDMLGDGDAEPWVGKQYRRICKLLGYTSNRRRIDAARTQSINTKMAERVKEVGCQSCGGQLKQTRSGAMRAMCEQCGSLFQLLKTGRSAKGGAA
ncbi:hypothetical protein [Franconibacter daqui]|uniref:hypothetical protein n=1 Tax=Franconibacter daqui TaxID=2047724 RepID=UPI002DB7DDE4|nr:hypothetical protein [Franconibacter daqui]MEB5922753.1 hypothetical protein [Franconibacter daqui]